MKTVTLFVHADKRSGIFTAETINSTATGKSAGEAGRRCGAKEFGLDERQIAVEPGPSPHTLIASVKAAPTELDGVRLRTGLIGALALACWTGAMVLWWCYWRASR